MKKWSVKITTVIQAEDRSLAWIEANTIIQEKLRNLANVTAISLEPLGNPDEWIALNEPIRARK